MLKKAMELGIFLHRGCGVEPWSGRVVRLLGTLRNGLMRALETEFLPLWGLCERNLEGVPYY
jgi:hypothetical protein